MTGHESARNIKKNIGGYYEKEASLCERMAANVSEAVHLVAPVLAKEGRAGQFFASDAFTEMLEMSDCLPLFPSDLPERLIFENRGIGVAKLTADESICLADFCRKSAAALRKSLKKRLSPAIFAGGFEDGDNEPLNTVSAVENPAITAAFEYFARRTPALRITLAQNFAAACEDVAAGRTGYCIIPLENARDGILLSFLSLIERYELFITRSCTVTGADGVPTRFALLCRDAAASLGAAAEQCMVCRFSGHDSNVLSRAFSALPAFELKIVRTASVPLAYTDGYAHVCTFSGNAEMLFAFAMFLTLIRADFEIKGIYDIESE